MLEQAGRQQQCVTSQPRRQPGHRRRVTSERSSELSVGRPGVEAGRNGHGKSRSLQVVGHGEGLERKGPAAGQADESRYRATVALSDKDSVTMKPERPALMMRTTASPRTVLGHELIRRNGLDGLIRPLHARRTGKRRADPGTDDIPTISRIAPCQSVRGRSLRGHRVPECGQFGPAAFPTVCAPPC
jgi:hypothetical protein